MSDNKRSKMNSNSSINIYSSSLIANTITVSSSLSSQVKLVVHRIAIENKEIRPREVQALMDEFEALVIEGSLF
jgi:hypothetical protein